MQWNLSKMWQAAAASLVAVTSYVSADADSAQMRHLENRVNALEQRKGVNGVINPNARPEIRDGADLFVTLDALLWQAHEGGLEFAVRDDHRHVHTPLRESRAKNPHFEYDWGFRLGLGYNLPHDGWDLYADWTRIHLHAHHHVSIDREEHMLWPTRIIPRALLDMAGTTPVSAEKASAHWRGHLNLIDLEMGREFFTSKWLTLRPFAGLRNAWVNQRYRVDYKNLYNLTPITDAVGTVFEEFVKVHMKNNFWGLGPRFGLDTQWGLGAGWSVFGDFAFSILYGFFKTEVQEQDISVTKTINEGLTPFAGVRDSFRQSVPVTDLQLGLRWDKMFCGDRFHIGLQAGWEHHMFFGQNQMMRFVDDTELANFVVDQGDLSTQGWTFSGRFDF